MPATNYYDILGVPPGASAREIRDAYHAQIKVFHPDVFDGPPTVGRVRALELNGAYAVLKDPERRRAYDLLLAQEVLSHTHDGREETAWESFRWEEFPWEPPRQEAFQWEELGDEPPREAPPQAAPPLASPPPAEPRQEAFQWEEFREEPTQAPPLLSASTTPQKAGRPLLTRAGRALLQFFK